jgi:6-phosphogluconolactonase (cycloisomerase 2 family)
MQDGMEGQMEGQMEGAVYVQTNEPENRVMAFRRAPDGTLTKPGTYATGGSGSNMPHLPSQGSVILTSDKHHLLVANAASDDVSIFRVTDSGLELATTMPSGGATPRSIAERDGLVFVLNTGKPSVTGFRITDGMLAPVMGAEHSLSATDADPAQVGFSPDGSSLIVTERGTNSIVSYTVNADGTLGMPQAHPSSGPTPYGFAFTSRGTLVVTEAFGAQKGKAAASSYAAIGGSIVPITASVGNGRSEICWAVATKDGRYVYTTNFADGAVSRYAVGMDGTLTLEDAMAGIAVDGATGLRDEDLSADGKYLYAIDADSQRIFGWGVGDGGTLRPIGSWEGVPATVAGLAAR